MILFPVVKQQQVVSLGRLPQLFEQRILLHPVLSGVNQELQNEATRLTTIISELELTTMVVFLSTLEQVLTPSNGPQQMVSFQPTHGMDSM